MNPISFSFLLERKEESSENVRDFLSYREIVKKLDDRNIIINGTGETVERVREELLTIEYLSLIIVNPESIEMKKRNGNEVEKTIFESFSNNSFLPLSNFDDVSKVARYDILHGECLINDVNLLFENDVAKNLIEKYLVYIFYLYDHRWRFRKNARWNSICEILKVANQDLSNAQILKQLIFNLRGFIFIEKVEDNKIILLTPPKNEVVLNQKYQLTYIDADSLVKNDILDNSKPFNELNESELCLLFDKILSINGENVENYIIFSWIENDFENEDLFTRDAPFLDFITSLIGEKYKCYKNVKITSINNLNLEVDIDFDVFGKAINKNEFIAIESKQICEKERQTPLSQFLKYLGRILYFKDIVNSYLPSSFLIKGIFITTGRLNVTQKIIFESISISIIRLENIDELFEIIRAM